MPQQSAAEPTSRYFFNLLAERRQRITMRYIT